MEKSRAKKSDEDKKKDELLRVIGQQKIENDFLKKLDETPLSEKRKLIDRSNLSFSLRRQCEMLGIHKSGLYYKPKGESELNLELMRPMDEHFLEHP